MLLRTAIEKELVAQFTCKQKMEEDKEETAGRHSLNHQLQCTALKIGDFITLKSLFLETEIIILKITA